MWTGLADEQRRRILTLAAEGRLAADMYESAIGTAGGVTDFDDDRNYIAASLGAYAWHTRRTLGELYDAIIPVPDIGRGRLGAVTWRGNRITERHAWAWHHAKQLEQLCAQYGDTVCEIGGGVGFTAAYALRSNIRTWVSVDLLPSLIHQYVLLSQWFPVQFAGPVRAGAINLYDALGDWRPLVGSMPIWMATDNLSEMDPAVAAAWPHIAREQGAQVFYSVQREFAGINVRQLFEADGWRIVSSEPFPRLDFTYEQFVAESK